MTAENPAGRPEPTFAMETEAREIYEDVREKLYGLVDAVREQDSDAVLDAHSTVMKKMLEPVEEKSSGKETFRDAVFPYIDNGRVEDFYETLTDFMSELNDEDLSLDYESWIEPVEEAAESFEQLGSEMFVNYGIDREGLGR